jgi:hypothetical protein
MEKVLDKNCSMLWLLLLVTKKDILPILIFSHKKLSVLTIKVNLEVRWATLITTAYYPLISLTGL